MLHMLFHLYFFVGCRRFLSRCARRFISRSARGIGKNPSYGGYAPLHSLLGLLQRVSYGSGQIFVLMALVSRNPQCSVIFFCSCCFDSIFKFSPKPLRSKHYGWWLAVLSWRSGCERHWGSTCNFSFCPPSGDGFMPLVLRRYASMPSLLPWYHYWGPLWSFNSRHWFPGWSPGSMVFPTFYASWRDGQSLVK